MSRWPNEAIRFQVQDKASEYEAELKQLTQEREASVDEMKKLSSTVEEQSGEAEKLREEVRWNSYPAISVSCTQSIICVNALGNNAQAADRGNEI